MEHDLYTAIPSQPLKPGVTFLHPSSFVPVKLDAPAIDVMTDFMKVTPVSVSANISLIHANAIMNARGIRLLFVTDDSNDFVGIITARDTMGERPIKHIHDRSVKHDEIRVADLMTPYPQLDAFQMSDVLHAKVGHILQTLRQMGRQHALVVEPDARTGKDKVRGIFSATAIGRLLGVPVQIFEVAHTFAEIEAALAVT